MNEYLISFKFIGNDDTWKKPVIAHNAEEAWKNLRKIFVSEHSTYIPFLLDIVKLGEVEKGTNEHTR